MNLTGIRPVTPSTLTMAPPSPKWASTQHSHSSCRLHGSLWAKPLSTAHCLYFMDQNHHSSDVPEHSGHRVAISCWRALENADMWPFWSTDAEVQTGGLGMWLAWRSKVLEKNVYDSRLWAPGNAKNNMDSVNRPHCRLHLISARSDCPFSCISACHFAV